MIMTRVDPAELEAIAILKREGLDRDQIRKLLGISRRTYYYRLAEIERVKQEAEKLMRAEE